MQTIRSDGRSFQTTYQLTTDNHKSAEDYIGIYQKFISGLRGGECPMFPSCSNYALQAINRQGFVKGVVAGTDRLLRCGHEHKLYPITLQENGFKLLDPADEQLHPELVYRNQYQQHPINVVEKDSRKNLIALLITETLYREALVEIYRYRLKTSDSSAELIANEFICYNALKEYGKLVYKYETLRQSSLKSDYSILKQVLFAYYQLQNDAAIRKLIHLMQSIPPEQELLARDCQYLFFASFLRSNRTMEAAQMLVLPSPQDPYLPAAKMALSKWRQQQKKSPLLGGVLSAIVPGAGYAYAGSYLTAVSALVFNGLMSYAAVSSYQSGNKGMGLLTGLFGVAFYIGNIQGSVKQVRRVNAAGSQKIIRQFEQHIPIF